MECAVQCNFCGKGNYHYESNRRVLDETRDSYYRCTSCGKVLCGPCMNKFKTERKQRHVFKATETWNECPSCGGKMLQIAESHGGCFITTATLSSLKTIDDNCNELATFRHFRDTWLKEHHPQDITEYYEIAPRIVSGINASADSSKVYNNIWNNYLRQCMSLIEQGRYDEAYMEYKQMVNELRVYAN